MINTHFRQIDIKDLLFVILYSAVISVLFGLILGFIDVFLSRTISLTFSTLLYWIVAVYLGRTTKRIVKNPHIVYTVIAFLGMISAWMIIDSLPTYYIVYTNMGVGMWDWVFNIPQYYRLGIQFFNPLFMIQNFSILEIVRLLIVGVGTYLGIKETF